MGRRKWQVGGGGGKRKDRIVCGFRDFGIMKMVNSRDSREKMESS